jgi:hypothetical protein
MKLFLYIATVFLFSSSAKAQLNFSFLPELYGRSVDGLGVFQLHNLGNEKLEGRIFITVTESRSQAVVLTVMSPVYVINRGSGQFPKSVFNSSTFKFAANSYGALANQTRNFLPGEYTFCFRFIPSEKQPLGEYENCFESKIEPLVPLSLLSPGEYDTICQKRPLLSWQPPLPFHAGVRFRLLLTEKRKGTALESLLLNNPLLLLDNINSTAVNYPSVNPELQEGKTYCWQVIAYEKGIITSRSEIWEFTVQCNEKVPPSPTDSYRELKLLMNGNYYIATNYLKFSYQNYYAIKKLHYEILDMERQKIKDVPEVKIQQGLNKIDIDLGGLDLSPGKHYILKVYPFNEPAIEVRFVYQAN